MLLDTYWRSFLLAGFVFGSKGRVQIDISDVGGLSSLDSRSSMIMRFDELLVDVTGIIVDGLDFCDNSTGLVIDLMKLIVGGDDCSILMAESPRLELVMAPRGRSKLSRQSWT